MNRNRSRSLVTAAALVAVVALLTACSTGGAAAVAATPPAEADLTVVAEGNAFDRAEITISAGEPVQLFFHNLDGAPHNIGIYTDASTSESLFVGEVITDDTVLYEIPALEPGEYFFRCDVHPSMNGTLVLEG